MLFCSNYAKNYASTIRQVLVSQVSGRTFGKLLSHPHFNMTAWAPCSMTFHTGRIKGLVRAKPYILLITKIIGRIGPIVFLQS